MLGWVTLKLHVGRNKMWFVEYMKFLLNVEYLNFFFIYVGIYCVHEQIIVDLFVSNEELQMNSFYKHLR